MISLQQIKAARALLEWTQRDLAKISGISLAAIAQIERGAGNPREETLRTLQQTLEKYSIEFSDEPGVKIRREPFEVLVWQGHEAMLKCWASKNYRIVPPQATSPHAPSSVYETKVAMIKMRDPIRIVRVNNPTIAESFLTQFQYHWDNGKKYG